MFGIRYFALSGLLIPWFCHYIGLHPMLRYAAPSGLPLYSPEKAIYNSEAVTPLAINMNDVIPPLVIKKEKL